MISSCWTSSSRCCPSPNVSSGSLHQNLSTWVMSRHRCLQGLRPQVFCWCYRQLPGLPVAVTRTLHPREHPESAALPDPGGASPRYPTPGALAFRDLVPLSYQHSGRRRGHRLLRLALPDPGGASPRRSQAAPGGGSGKPPRSHGALPF